MTLVFYFSIKLFIILTSIWISEIHDTSIWLFLLFVILLYLNCVNSCNQEWLFLLFCYLTIMWKHLLLLLLFILYLIKTHEAISYAVSMVLWWIFNDSIRWCAILNNQNIFMHIYVIMTWIDWKTNMFHNRMWMVTKVFLRFCMYVNLSLVFWYNLAYFICDEKCFIDILCLSHV